MAEEKERPLGSPRGAWKRKRIREETDEPAPELGGEFKGEPAQKQPAVAIPTVTVAEIEAADVARTEAEAAAEEEEERKRKEEAATEVEARFRAQERRERRELRRLIRERAKERKSEPAASLPLSQQTQPVQVPGGGAGGGESIAFEEPVGVSAPGPTPASLQEEINATREQIRDIAEKLFQCEQDRERTERKNKRLQDVSDEVQEAAERELGEATARALQLEETIAKARTDLEECNKKMEELAKRAANCESKVARSLPEIQKQLEEQRNGLTLRDQEIVTLKKQMDVVKALLESTKTKLAFETGANKERINRNLALQNAERHAEGLESELAQKEGQRAQLAVQNLKLNENLHKQIEANKELAAMTQTTLQQVEAEKRLIAIAQQQAEESTRKCQEELKQVRDQLIQAELKSVPEDFKERFRVCQEELAKFRTEYQNVVSERNAQVEQHEKDLRALQQNVEIRRKRQDELEQTATRLQEQLNETKTRLEQESQVAKVASEAKKQADELKQKIYQEQKEKEQKTAVEQASSTYEFQSTIQVLKAELKRRQEDLLDEQRVRLAVTNDVGTRDARLAEAGRQIDVLREQKNKLDERILKLTFDDELARTRLSDEAGRQFQQARQEITTERSEKEQALAYIRDLEQRTRDQETKINELLGQVQGLGSQLGAARGQPTQAVNTSPDELRPPLTPLVFNALVYLSRSDGKDPTKDQNERQILREFVSSNQHLLKLVHQVVAQARQRFRCLPLAGSYSLQDPRWITVSTSALPEPVLAQQKSLPKEQLARAQSVTVVMEKSIMRRNIDPKPYRSLDSLLCMAYATELILKSPDKRATSDPIYEALSPLRNQARGQEQGIHFIDLTFGAFQSVMALCTDTEFAMAIAEFLAESNLLMPVESLSSQLLGMLIGGSYHQRSLVKELVWLYDNVLTGNTTIQTRTQQHFKIRQSGRSVTQYDGDPCWNAVASKILCDALQRATGDSNVLIGSRLVRRFASTQIKDGEGTGDNYVDLLWWQHKDVTRHGPFEDLFVGANLAWHKASDEDRKNTDALFDLTRTLFTALGGGTSQMTTLLVSYISNNRSISSLLFYLVGILYAPEGQWHSLSRLLKQRTGHFLLFLFLTQIAKARRVDTGVFNPWTGLDRDRLISKATGDNKDNPVSKATRTAFYSICESAFAKALQYARWDSFFVDQDVDLPSPAPTSVPPGLSSVLPPPPPPPTSGPFIPVSAPSGTRPTTTPILISAPTATTMAAVIPTNLPIVPGTLSPIPTPTQAPPPPPAPVAPRAEELKEQKEEKETKWPSSQEITNMSSSEIAEFLGRTNNLVRTDLQNILRSQAQTVLAARSGLTSDLRYTSPSPKTIASLGSLVQQGDPRKRKLPDKKDVAHMSTHEIQTIIEFFESPYKPVTPEQEEAEDIVAYAKYIRNRRRIQADLIPAARIRAEGETKR